MQLLYNLCATLIVAQCLLSGSTDAAGFQAEVQGILDNAKSWYGLEHKPRDMHELLQVAAVAFVNDEPNRLRTVHDDSFNYCVQVGPNYAQEFIRTFKRDIKYIVARSNSDVSMFNPGDFPNVDKVIGNVEPNGYLNPNLKRILQTYKESMEEIVFEQAKPLNAELVGLIYKDLKELRKTTFQKARFFG